MQTFEEVPQVKSSLLLSLTISPESVRKNELLLKE